MPVFVVKNRHGLASNYPPFIYLLRLILLTILQVFNLALIGLFVLILHLFKLAL